MKNFTKVTTCALAIVAASLHQSAAFSLTNPTLPTSRTSSSLFMSDDKPQKKGFFQNFFEELDAFVDDATSRRLGNGAQYYGKRKSSFYGKDDVNRKADKVSWSIFVGSKFILHSVFSNINHNFFSTTFDFKRILLILQVSLLYNVHFNIFTG